MSVSIEKIIHMPSYNRFRHVCEDLARSRFYSQHAKQIAEEFAADLEELACEQGGRSTLKDTVSASTRKAVMDGIKIANSSSDKGTLAEFVVQLGNLPHRKDRIVFLNELRWCVERLMEWLSVDMHGGFMRPFFTRGLHKDIDAKSADLLSLVFVGWFDGVAKTMLDSVLPTTFMWFDLYSSLDSYKDEAVTTALMAATISIKTGLGMDNILTPEMRKLVKFTIAAEGLVGPMFDAIAEGTPYAKGGLPAIVPDEKLSEQLRTSLDTNFTKLYAMGKLLNKI